MVILAMYGIEGPALAAGWAIHQFHGIVLGLTYVALVQFDPFIGPARHLGGSLALSVAYGILTTIGLAVIVMPLWLSAVGFPMAPPFPNVAFPGTILSLVGHIVYAIPVALAYAFVNRRVIPPQIWSADQLPSQPNPDQSRCSERQEELS